MPFYYRCNATNPWEDWHFEPYDLTLTTDLALNLDNLLSKKRTTLPGIIHVQFNKESGHTTIVWDDDTSTTVGCAEGSEFEEYVGFCAAVAKKLFGSTSAVKKLIEDKDVDAARKRKTRERDERIRQQQEFERQNHERAVRRAAKKKLFDAEVDEMVARMLNDREKDSEDDEQ